MEAEVYSSTSTPVYDPTKQSMGSGSTTSTTKEPSANYVEPEPTESSSVTVSTTV